MGLEFIDRLLRTSALVLLIFVPFGLYYFGFYPTIAVLSGCVWGMLNLMLLTRLIKQTLRADGDIHVPSVVVTIVIFILLFVAGFGLLSVSLFEPWLLLVGFTGIFAIMLLKALGRWMTKADDQTTMDQKLESVA